MINVQDVINRIGDYTGNYTVGQASNAQKIRAVDFAVNAIFTKLGPQQAIYNFRYYQDTLYYNLPTAFKEFITLTYEDINDNTGPSWAYRAYPDLKRFTGGNGGGNIVSHTKAYTGSNQLVMVGSNIMQGATLETFDIDLFTASDDASSIALDANIKVQGSASQKFNVTNAIGTAKISKNGYHWDFTSLHNNEGALKVYSFLPSINLTNIKIRYGNGTATSSTNYYTITVTSNADGSAWTVSDWNLLGFDTLNKVVTGSPDETDINFVEFTLTLGVGFTTVNNFRFDWLYTSFPDRMELLYYSNKKGQDANGNDITTITATTDNIILNDDDYIEPLAIKATLYLFPQLRGNPEFMMMYKQDYQDVIKDYAMRQPRYRNENNYQASRLRR